MKIRLMKDFEVVDPTGLVIAQGAYLTHLVSVRAAGMLARNDFQEWAAKHKIAGFGPTCKDRILLIEEGGGDLTAVDTPIYIDELVEKVRDVCGDVMWLHLADIE